MQLGAGGSGALDGGGIPSESRVRVSGGKFHTPSGQSGTGAADFKASPLPPAPLDVGNCWLVDCGTGSLFVPKTVILETLRLQFGYPGDNFGDPGIQRDAQWTHWGPGVHVYRF